MKSPVELNSLLSKLFCYITWLEATVDDLQARLLRHILLFLWNNGLTVYILQTGLIKHNTGHLAKEKGLYFKSYYFFEVIA